MKQKTTGNARAAIPEAGARERLLAAAMELFNRKGYAATTVREIVAAAGVTKPALYYYFRNKEGLYLDLMSESLARFEAILGTSRSDGGTAGAKILMLCDRLLVFLIENIKIARVMYFIYYGPPQGAPFFDCDAFHDKFRDAVRVLVQEGRKTGEFHRSDAEDMSWAILGAVNTAIDLELYRPALSLGRKGLARVLKLILTGLQKRDSSEG
jgi:AcrR family transcriptional regulator